MIDSEIEIMGSSTRVRGDLILSFFFFFFLLSAVKIFTFLNSSTQYIINRHVEPPRKRRRTHAKEEPAIIDLSTLPESPDPKPLRQLSEVWNDNEIFQPIEIDSFETNPTRTEISPPLAVASTSKVITPPNIKLEPQVELEDEEEDDDYYECYHAGFDLHDESRVRLFLCSLCLFDHVDHVFCFVSCFVAVESTGKV